MEITLTKQQARRFLLLKQGLLGEYRFIEKDGIVAYIRQAGCIQFDPIDVCGKNAELVLQSRVKGFMKKMLSELLYEERRLFDFFDKNLAIMDLSDWPYLERIREGYRQGGRGKDEIDRIEEEIKAIVKDRGEVSSKDIGFNEKVDWYWSSTKLARAALESLYFRGDLVIHHKKGTNKYYCLAEKIIPEELLKLPDPYPEDLEHYKWRVLRRISAIGLLWNKPSDAWLGIWNFRAQDRKDVFRELLSERKILPVRIEGSKELFYCLKEDEQLLHQLPEPSQQKPRTELIAPLDCLLWDRKLIKELFDFEYKWEIYTPKEQRKYGYYILPILSGDRFIGRVEVISAAKQKALLVKKLWLEDDVKPTKKLFGELHRCFTRFMKFHGLKEIIYETDQLG